MCVDMAMTRPLYEKKENLELESGVAETLEQLWDCKAVKLSIKYGVDFALTRGNDVIAWAEIKCRDVEAGHYPSLLLSLDKWIAGNRLAVETGKGFLIVVRYLNGIFYVNTKDIIKPKIGFGGRTDRGDWQDQEPCVFIENKKFTFLKEL